MGVPESVNAAPKMLFFVMTYTTRLTNIIEIYVSCLGPQLANDSSCGGPSAARSDRIECLGIHALAISQLWLPQVLSRSGTLNLHIRMEGVAVTQIGSGEGNGSEAWERMWAGCG
jgi:hypothetical protein